MANKKNSKNKSRNSSGKAKKSKSTNKAANAYSKTNSAPSAQGLMAKPPRSVTNKVSRARHHKNVCDITNPFCLTAKGTLYPDKAAGQRLAYQLRGLVPFGADATGNAFALFTPTLGSLANSYCTGGSTAGNFGIWGLADANWKQYAGIANLVSYGSNVRIVSWGVILRSNTPVSTTQGYLIMSEYNQPIGGDTIPVGTLFGSRVITKPLSPGLEYSWISTPNSEEARLFQGYTAENIIEADGKWSSLFVQVVGAAASATAVCTAEYFINVEVMVDTYSSISQFLGPAPPHNPVAVAASSSTLNKVQGFVEGGVVAVENKIKSLAADALDEAATMAGDFFSFLL